MHSQYGSKAKHTGEMAEWSNAAVLKTVDCNRSGGSNPSFSANQKGQRSEKSDLFFCFKLFVIGFTKTVRKLKIFLYKGLIYK